MALSSLASPAWWLDRVQGPAEGRDVLASVFVSVSLWGAGGLIWAQSTLESTHLPEAAAFAPSFLSPSTVTTPDQCFLKMTGTHPTGFTQKASLATNRRQALAPPSRGAPQGHSPRHCPSFYVAPPSTWPQVVSWAGLGVARGPGQSFQRATRPRAAGPLNCVPLQIHWSPYRDPDCVSR